MKCVVNQKEFKKHLDLVSRAVATRPTHPILANLLLSAKDNQITLSGFDLSLGIRSQFTAEVEQEGEITLPAKLLTDIVARLPEGDVTIAFEFENEYDENPLVEIVSVTGGKFKIRGVKATEYPDLPLIDEGESLLLPKQELAKGLKSTLFSSSKDENKQVLTGVRIIGGEDSIEFASTDGHRLSVRKLEATVKPFGLTIPVNTLSELNSLLTSTESEEIELLVEDNLIMFKVESTVITSRILDGTYPNYHQLIPSNFSTEFNVDRYSLLNCLNRISVLATDKNNLIRFTLTDDNLKLTVTSGELGNAKESIKVDFSGSFEVGFNLKYLLEGLKSFDNKEITFHCNQPTQPVIITGMGNVEQTYLIMPVQLKD